MTCCSTQRGRSCSIWRCLSFWPGGATAWWDSSGVVEHHGLEAVASKEAELFVEPDGWMVGLGDGQRDGLETGLGQLGHAVLEKHLAEVMAAPASGDAELGDVG